MARTSLQQLLEDAATRFTTQSRINVTDDFGDEPLSQVMYPAGAVFMEIYWGAIANLSSDEDAVAILAELVQLEKQGKPVRIDWSLAAENEYFSCWVSDVVMDNLESGGFTSMLMEMVPDHEQIMAEHRIRLVEQGYILDDEGEIDYDDEGRPRFRDED